LPPRLCRRAFAAAPAPTQTIAPRPIEVPGRAATVHGITGPDGRPGLNGAAMTMPGMIHANDVAYDAHLANDRTLGDPEVIAREPGPLRPRIINGATATAFWIDAGALEARIIAVDGNPALPSPARVIPMTQGQRLDLVLTIPLEGGAFPILAQVEASVARTGVILATPGAAITRLADQAGTAAPHIGTEPDAFADRPRSAAVPPRPAAQVTPVMLDMEPGYRWTINGAVHGAAPPLQAALGSRVEIMFMNPTMMMHSKHLQGHQFQIMDLGKGRFGGPVRAATWWRCRPAAWSPWRPISTSRATGSCIATTCITWQAA
jgi:FtsP/CotA-like multicopper oxidase with cupredoxin domain